MNPISAPDSFVQVMAQVMLFVPLGDLHGPVPSMFVDSSAVLLIGGKSGFNRFVKVIPPMERRIIPSRFCPGLIISGYKLLADLLTTLQTYSSPKISTEDQQDSINGC